ncbi:hypothetical protein DACRYDRAFT_112732 [Dacryopinax primogenitus]|uniref:Uncharacterized protein n=1 Tax=Dacryopinax primogenitus (strain DJM 731) TaxID=1858805 RepID=M5FY54_DACPD|nr:uncharacterized protein DACRYDRAFT_112732 [Dacryopinax primogenitus]EJT96472.1 hypothetical protein DACRYDRAFT_112732 [Dacryopinax primogenitus]
MPPPPPPLHLLEFWEDPAVMNLEPLPPHLGFGKVKEPVKKPAPSEKPLNKSKDLVIFDEKLVLLHSDDWHPPVGIIDLTINHGHGNRDEWVGIQGSDMPGFFGS